MGNSILNKAKYTGNTDEWYTDYNTIDKEVPYYTEQLRNKRILCNCDNPYIPSPAKIIDIIKHTDIEWTFRVNADTSKTKPGQFYEMTNQ